MTTNSSGPCASFRFATHALALLGFALVLVNVGLITNAKALQQQVADRQSQLNDDSRASDLTGQIVQLIARTVIDKNDQQLQTLLASQGIKVESKQAPTAATSPAATGADTKNSK